MTKYFSKTIDKYFIAWISVDTWDSHHAYDMKRFYKFLKALLQYSRKPWLGLLHENIIQAVKKEHPYFDEGTANESAGFFSSLAVRIYDFNSTVFPDPLVEMKNPYSVLTQLRRQKIYSNGNSKPLYSENQINSILEENFGENWQEEW